MAQAWGDGEYGVIGFGGFTTANIDATGISANADLGAIATRTQNFILLSGVSAEAQLGEETPVDQTEWGGSYWGGPLGWGGNLSAEASVTGVSATVNTAKPLDTFTAYNNAKLSTAQYKFGDASAVFDGLFDYIRPDENSTWGSGDFTVEFWFYYSSIGASNYFLFDNRTDTTNGLLIFIDTSNRVTCVVNGGVGGLALTAVSTNTWNSVSLVRSGTAMSFYVNGTKIGNLSANSTNYSGRKYSIGASSYSSPGSFGFNGYIDEFRASTTARYSGASYTPATTEFSPDVYTTDLLHFDGANGSTVITNSATSGVVSVIGEAYVEVTGVVSTAALGAVGSNAGNNVTPAGVQANFAIGDETMVGVANIYPTSATGTGVIGHVVTKSENFIAVTGVVGNGQLGEPDIVGTATVETTGVLGTGQTGTVVASIPKIVSVTGVVGTVALGEEEVQADVNVQVTGVSGSGAVGSVTFTGDAKVYLTGVSAQGLVSRPLVWGLIDTSQTPNWLPIAA